MPYEPQGTGTRRSGEADQMRPRGMAVAVEVLLRSVGLFLFACLA